MQRHLRALCLCPGYNSVHSEERNRLRLQAWEQRNQEASQAKELNPENVPLFGEPYKVKVPPLHSPSCRLQYIMH